MVEFTQTKGARTLDFGTHGQSTMTRAETLAAITLALTGLVVCGLVALGISVALNMSFLKQFVNNTSYLSCCVGKVCEAVGNATGEKLCQQKCSAPKYYCAGELDTEKKDGTDP